MGGTGVVAQGASVFTCEGYRCGLADVHKTALRLHAAGHFDKRCHACGVLGVEHARAIETIAGHA